jgi:hypothetical protein
MASTFIESYTMLKSNEASDIYTVSGGAFQPGGNPCPLGNGANDWLLSRTNNSSNTTLTCAKIRPRGIYPPGSGVCPGFGPIYGKGPVDLSWVTNEDQFTPVAPPGRIVNCKYNKNAITTPEDVTYWQKTFLNPNLPKNVLAHNENVFNNELLPDLCFQPAGPGECTPDNGIIIQNGSPCAGSTGVTGTGLTGCTRITSIGPWSSICAGWAERQNGSTFISTKMREYCANNICSIDCRCINRDIVDQLYNAIASRYQGHDACWYAPCRNFRKYLVPNSVRVNPDSCPDIACQIVVNAYNQQDGSIDINIGEATISCNGLNGNTGPVDPPGGDIINNIDSIWEQYQVYILIGLAIFGILFFILILYAIYDNKGEPNASPNNTPPVIIPKQDSNYSNNL